jgi:hypothetical protein
MTQGTNTNANDSAQQQAAPSDAPVVSTGVSAASSVAIGKGAPQAEMLKGAERSIGLPDSPLRAFQYAESLTDPNLNALFYDEKNKVEAIRWYAYAAKGGILER